MSGAFTQTQVLLQVLSPDAVISDYLGVIPDGVLVYYHPDQYFKLGIGETWVNTPILFSVNEIHTMKELYDTIIPRCDSLENHINQAIADLRSDIQSGEASSNAATLQGYSPNDFAWKAHQHMVSDLIDLLDTNGKIKDAYIPSLAISDTFVVNNQADMLALNAQKGDLAIRNDGTGTWILNGDDSSVLANWKQLKSPTDIVTSVAGRTGAVVLTTADIGGLTTLLDQKANASHQHSASNITSGILPIVRGGTGFSSYVVNEFLVGDATGILVKKTAAEVLNIIGAAPFVHNHNSDYYTKTQLDSALSLKSDVSHTHTIPVITGLQDALNSKSDASHLHDTRYYTQSQITAYLATKSNTGHTHVIADTTGLQASLDSKSDTGHIHAISNVTGLQTALDGKSAITHNHDTSYYTKTEMNSYLATKANSSHIHAISEVTSLQTTLDSKASLSHTHALSNIVDLLDGNGKINSTLLPSIALMDVFEVSSDAAMLSLSAQKGDIAIRSDVNKTFILALDPATVLANWKELKTPTDTVTSVAGKTGNVTLTISDISNLQSSLDGKSNTGHAHVISDISNLQTSLDGKSNISHNHDTSYYTKTQIDTYLMGKANVSHAHNISDVSNLATELSLKFSKSGGMLTGPVTQLMQPLNNFGTTNGLIQCNVDSANHFLVTPNGNINVTFSGASSSSTISFVLEIIATGTSRTVTWSSSIKWPNGTAPQIDWTAGRINFFVFNTPDGGTTWRGKHEVLY